MLDAARQAFAEHGYERATVRDIAGRAGVDPAMIHHYFGSKEKLFQTVIDLPIDPGDVLALDDTIPPQRLGEHLVRSILRVWDSFPDGVGLAVLRSATGSAVAAAMLRDFVFARAIRPAVDRVETDPERAAWRTCLAATQLAGLILVRYVLRVEPMASAAPDVVVAAVAGQVQHYLTGEIGAV